MRRARTLSGEGLTTGCAFQTKPEWNEKKAELPADGTRRRHVIIVAYCDHYGICCARDYNCTPDLEVIFRANESFPVNAALTELRYFFKWFRTHLKKNCI